MDEIERIEAQSDGTEAAEPTLAALRAEVETLRLEAAVDRALAETGAKRPAAVRALLGPFLREARVEDGMVPGLSEALDGLMGNPETAAMFRGSEKRFLGRLPGEGADAPEGMPGFDARLEAARQSGDMLAAIRIKQEAAKDGVILI